jgi:hypothetical protein
MLTSIIAVGATIALSNLGIARAERASPNSSCSSSAYCLFWKNTSSGGAIEGQATSGNGVYGTTASTDGNSAVAGVATSSSGSAHGVYGRSSNGQGVYGTSTVSNGVEGHSTGTDRAGIAGYQLGTSNGGYGAYAESADTTTNYGAIYAQGDNSQTNLLDAYNKATDTSCVITAVSDLDCSGSIVGGAVRVRHRTSDSRQVLTYSTESASATIEDVGTARMSDGVAIVRIDPAFASVMDRNWYYVFLTPLGDTRGLYVSVKTPTAFQVRETQHGRSTLEFDYRIVAHPRDADNDRLPLAPKLRRPQAATPSVH